MPVLLTPKDAAERLGVGVQLVYEWCARTDDPLPHVVVGKSGRFRRIIAAEIDGWLSREADRRAGAGW